MPTLSLITAVSNSSLPFLDEAWRSVRNLRLPLGWQIEWCIQQDGDGPRTRREWFGDPRVKFDNSDRWLWAAGTRNLALTRAAGDYILSLDADDLLEPDAVCHLAAGFEQDPEVVWSFGRLDELVDGVRLPRLNDVVYDGLCPAGWFSDQIRLRRKTPFPSAMTMYRAEALLSVGGWPAFTEQEDTILLVHVNRHWKGWLTNAVVGQYRRHADQTTKKPWFQDPVRTEQMYAYLDRLGLLSNWRPGVQQQVVKMARH